MGVIEMKKTSDVKYRLNDGIFVIFFICLEAAAVLCGASVVLSYIYPASIRMTLLSAELFSSGLGVLLVSVVVATIGDLIVKHDLAKKE